MERIRTNKYVIPLYLQYLFVAMYQDDITKLYIKQTTGIQNLDLTRLLATEKFCVPTIQEQKAIAKFLQTECSRINSIIEDMEQQVQILQKYKKSLITETVTKGLDLNVQLRDSGVDWIGEIPEHWGTNKIKFCSSKIGSGKTPLGGSDIYEEEGIIFIRSQNVYDDGLRLDEVKHISENIDNSMAGTRLIQGDVLLNITGASIGRCCIYTIKEPGNVNQHVCIIRTDSKLLQNEYLRYILNSDVGKNQIAVCQVGGNRESLTFEQIGLFNICVPPLEEQQEIIDYLDTHCNKIDLVLSQKQQAIETIKQYKKSVIFEYVTGKKRVEEVEMLCQ
ncbi:hypothetical protein LQ50_04455 [Halalkalibacter okhensis]|uniref:Type I restriction modification DNA specificity domain-containing protein n=1 Tax=Halalkalibacter okhensis TaxID=333138 RepID=A0A0B0IFX0_9BACI|nr:hypothetical protein LQ50_04455 [Halalkalibacter okhensis]